MVYNSNAYVKKLLKTKKSIPLYVMDKENKHYYAIPSVFPVTCEINGVKINVAADSYFLLNYRGVIAVISKYQYESDFILSKKNDISYNKKKCLIVLDQVNKKE